MTAPRRPDDRPVPDSPGRRKGPGPAPATQAPATPAPATPASAAQASAAQAPAAQAPAAQAPAAQAPAARAPAAQAPARDEARPLSPALDKTFKIGLVLKGLDGVLEVAGGLLLLFLSPHAIQHLVRVLTAHELSQDPHDPIARYLLHSTAHLNTGITIFGAIYLLSHGIAKIVLVALVLRDKLWAYPWLIALLLAFIGYQLYRITAVHFSIGLTLLTIFDAFLVWLTWREYRAKRAPQHRARKPVTAPSPDGHGPARPQPPPRRT